MFMLIIAVIHLVFITWQNELNVRLLYQIVFHNGN